MDALVGNEVYRDFMDKLTETKVSHYIDLPMIAVMGDTSSGKSSLLSSISMVDLPSSDKLTTRCPIMLQMSNADVRSATVTVKWKDIPAGKSESDIEFLPKHVDDASWSELTGSIAAAQKHIVDTSGKEVARDVVKVVLKGPQCEDLTLIDLPGIVRSSGKGESESLAADIQGLIDDYLQNSRCIILAVLPSNVDFHNSQIMADAKKVDPETKRTLPVLTKPDLIDKGGEKSVCDLLLGKMTSDFEKGFHMVKGRGQAALDDDESIEKGLRAEMNFFTNTLPWRKVEDRTLFGTPELRRKLGDLQMDLIRESLPSILKEMREKKLDAEQSLQLFGVSPANHDQRVTIFHDVRDKLVSSFRATMLHGGRYCVDEKSETYSARFHSTCTTFREALNGGRLAKISDLDVGADVIAVDGTDEHRGEIVFKRDSHIYIDGVYVGGKDISIPKSAIEKHDGIWYDAASQTVYEKETSSELFAFRAGNVRPDPQHIADLIERNKSFDLPIFVNTILFERIVADYIKTDWQSPCSQLVEESHNLLIDASSSPIQEEKLLSRFPRFKEFLLRRAEKVVDDLIKAARVKVEEFILREKIPYTQNHYLNECLSRVKSNKLQSVLLEALGVAKSNHKETMTKASIKSVIAGVFERNQKMSIDEHMAEDMLHALDAYGKVALKRFIDVVPMLCKDALMKFPDKINEELARVSEKDLEKLLCVSREDTTKRKMLEMKRDDLADGLAVFEEIF